MQAKHPMQPIELDEEGVPRFKANLLVRYMLDNHHGGMNNLASLPNIPKGDREQLAQLIGYSTSGFGDLSYASNEITQLADQTAEQLIEARDRANSD